MINSEYDGSLIPGTCVTGTGSLQEKAEARISHVYNELRESEKELRVLERELQVRV